MRLLKASEQRTGLPRTAAPITVVMALMLALAPDSVRAQGLLVSPTRIEAQVRPGDRLPAIELDNRSREKLQIRVALVPAVQELSGLPRFDLSAASLRAGRRLGRLSGQRLDLAPGQTRRVLVTVGKPAPGRIGVYGVVAFTARVASDASGAGAVVTPNVRLTTNLLLRYPGKTRSAGQVTALRVEQGPQRTLRFVGRMRNDGNLHVRPRARVTVRSAEGNVVVRRSFPAENVLPQSQRELAFDLRKSLPAGEYSVQVDARIGQSRSVQRARFRLVGPNELPTPKLEISTFAPPSPDAHKRFKISIGVRNTGTAAKAATGHITLSPAGAGRTLTRQDFKVSTLKPRQSRAAEVSLPGLEKGRYELTAALTDGGRTLSERTVVFITDTRPSLTERILDWMAAHIPLLLAGFALVLISVAGGLMTYIRRLRRAVRTNDSPTAG